MVRLYCVLIGCVFGLFQTAYILSRSLGFDIRDYGSGNSGMTNMLRTLGTKAGILVLVLDMLKIIIAICLTEALFGKTYPDMRYLLKLYTAAGCIIGHNYPFYMHFKGGKGVAVTAGFLCAFRPEFFPVAILSFLIPWLITHYVSLGSLCMVTISYVLMIVEGQRGVFTGAGSEILAEMYIVGGLITGLCWVQHRGNIGRLLHGTERKTYLGKKNHAALTQEDLEKMKAEGKKHG